MECFETIFVATDQLLLCKAETEQVRHVLRAAAAVQSYAARDGDVCTWFLTLFERNAVFLTLLNSSTFLQSFLARKERAAKIILP